MGKAGRRQSVGSYNADNAIIPFWNLPKNSLNTLDSLSKSPLAEHPEKRLYTI